LIPPAYVAWRADAVVVLIRQAGNQFLGSLTGLQIWATARQGGLHRLAKSIPGLLKSKKKLALDKGFKKAISNGGGRGVAIPEDVVILICLCNPEDIAEFRRFQSENDI
jgi:hypothetical protein